MTFQEHKINWGIEIHKEFVLLVITLIMLLRGNMQFLKADEENM